MPEMEQKSQNQAKLTAAVQLSYLPEQGQRMALEVSEKSGINITEKIAKEIRKAKMTEKNIREAIAGLDPEINNLTGKPIKLEEKSGLSDIYRSDCGSRLRYHTYCGIHNGIFQPGLFHE